MPHRSPPLQFPTAQPAPFAKGIQGLAGGFLLGMKIKQQREQDELDLKKNEIAQQRLNIDKAKFAQGKGQAFISAVESMIKLPSGTVKMMAPTVFQSFFDVESKEGKRFMAGLVNPSPEDGTAILKGLREAINFKGAGTIMATEEFKRDFFNSPIATFAKLQDAAKKAKDLEKAPKTKAVLNVSKTRAAGKPVLEFATEDQIQDSAGNLTPPPRGLKLRIGKDGTLEIATGGGKLTKRGLGRAEEISVQASELINNLGSLRSIIMGQIRTGAAKFTIGPVGTLLEFLNKTVANHIPALFSTDRAIVENAMKATVESGVRTVTSDTRFSNIDRGFVMALLPSAGFFESPQNALTKITILNALFIKRLGKALQAQGINVAGVPSLDDTQVKEMVQSGFLTFEEGVNTLKMLFPGKYGELQFDQFSPEIQARANKSF